MTRSTLPIWSGIGHLRLAEQGWDQAENCSRALVAFRKVGCRWGEIRATALTTAWPDPRFVTWLMASDLPTRSYREHRGCCRSRLTSHTYQASVKLLAGGR